MNMYHNMVLELYFEGNSGPLEGCVQYPISYISLLKDHSRWHMENAFKWKKAQVGSIPISGQVRHWKILAFKISNNTKRRSTGQDQKRVPPFVNFAALVFLIVENDWTEEV